MMPARLKIFTTKFQFELLFQEVYNQTCKSLLIAHEVVRKIGTIFS